MTRSTIISFGIGVLCGAVIQWAFCHWWFMPWVWPQIKAALYP